MKIQEAIGILVLLFLGARHLRERELNINTVWIFPLVIIYYWISHLKFNEPTASYILANGLAFGVGSVTGWLRGRMVLASIDRERNIVSVKGNWLSLLIWLVFVAAKFFVSAEKPFGIALDYLVTLSTSMIVSQRLCYLFQYRRATQPLEFVQRQVL